MHSLGAIKFHPIFKEKIWGGEKIKNNFEFLNVPKKKCGEVWLLSAVTGNESIVSNGNFAGNSLKEITEIFMDDLLGEHIYKKYDKEFPLLIKIIDANDYLSVQVHPDDATARKKHNLLFGKSEMWYIIQSEKDSKIVAGFNQPMNKESLLKHIAEGTLKHTLNYERVQNGDMIYIPSGLVHAMCPGLLIAEIQQTSDITYRLYDWDRADEQGNPRELHIEYAADAIDYSLIPRIIRNFKPVANQITPMIESPYFSTSFINLNTTFVKNLHELDSFVIYFSVSGSFNLLYDSDKISVFQGECVLIPAITEKITLLPEQHANVIEILPV